MLKRLTIAIFAAAMLLTAPVGVFAAPATTTHSVNFRSAPSLDGRILDNLSKGTKVNVLEQAGSYWYKAEVNGKTGYLSTKYVSMTGRSATVVKGVNFRSAPTTKGSDIYRLLPVGTPVTVLDEIDRVWIQIAVGGQLGYIDQKFIKYSASTGSPSTSTAGKIIAYGEKFLGTPYKFGATTYEKSGMFDCSSFVQYVYAEYGYKLPRTSIKQSKEGKFVARANLRVGDLLFFSTSTSKGAVGHVGIYTGDGMMLHTYGNGGVMYSTIKSGFWNNHYITARRVL